MGDLILDSTWSYRFRYLVFIKGHESPVTYYPATMTRYTEQDIKAEYKKRMDEIRNVLTGKCELFALSNYLFKANEVQSITLKLDLMNEMNRGKIHNDYPPILMDVLSKWYTDNFMEEADESI